MDPQRATSLGRQLVRMFGQHAHAHLLEHRQRVRQRDLRTVVIDLEPEPPLLAAGRAIQAERHAAGRQRIEPLQVLDRRARIRGLAVGGGKGVDVTTRQRGRARLVEPRVQFIAQRVLPAPRRGRELRFQRAPVDHGNAPGRGAHGDVDARQRRVGQQHVELGRGAREGIDQDLLELPAQLGRVVLARHEDQARHEASERIAPNEQAEALPLAELQDAVGDVGEFVGRHLEQFVARVAFQDVGQRLAEVARRGEPCTLDHLPHLAAHQRHVGHRRAVRDRREQADEAVLADDAAVGAVALHTDVVDVAGAMHRRARRGLGDQQQRRRRARQRARLARHGGETGRCGACRGRQALRRIAQDAEPAALFAHQFQLAAVIDEVLAAIAEQQHVVFGQPLQERARFGEFLARHRRRRAVELRDHGAQLRDHRLPVGDRRTHVAQHALDTGAERAARSRIGQPVHFDVHQRLARPVGLLLAGLHVEQPAGGVALHGEDRMDDQVQRQALPVDLHRRRIDEERHVVVDDFDDRVARAEARLRGRGVEHAQLRRAGRTILRKTVLGQRHAVQVVRAARGDVLGIELAVIDVAEAREPAAFVAGLACGDQCRDLGKSSCLCGIQAVCSAVVGRHRVSPL